MHDGNQLRRIAEAAELTKTDRVLEVGPGLGPLTELLVEQAGEVLAIEKDRRLFELLQNALRKRDKSFSCCMTMRWIFCDASGAIGAIGNWWPICHTRWRRRSWWNWRRRRGVPKRIVATLQLEVARAVGGEGRR